ncbi:MAG: carboxypeptidase-like regulatory domain-containing protein, partial [Lysobacter sp.]
IVPDDFGEAVLENGDTRALHTAVDWQGGRDNVQLNLLTSDGDIGPATGAWVDASARRGRYTHNYGVFRLEPGLAWGALPINNDVEGGYYRLGYQYGRWLWNAGIDSLQSISGNGFDGQYANGFARYQASSTLGYGGSLSVRHATEVSHAAQLFADKRTRWGQTRVQLDEARGGGSDSWQLSFDQAFDLKQGSRLSASVAYGALAYGGAASTNTTTLAFNGGRDLTDRLSLDGTARWTHASGPSAQRGLDLNLALNWRISSYWWLSTTLYQSEGSRRSPFILDPLVTETPFISTPRERSLFFTLRYERQSGRPLAIIGGAPGAAVGSVAGSLYLDDNGDGVRAASEQPAINVTVILDGRYSVRTDNAGNFEFPRVATGVHTLSVVSDNLPLPWSFDEATAQRSIQVTVRQAARVEIGARRPR